jgi:hypothetical protein
MGFLWISRLLLAAGLSCGIAAFAQQPDATVLLETADEMVQTAARLRGLEPRAPIMKGIKNRDEISQYINENIAEQYNPKKLQAEGKMLRKLGLIPASIDYREFVLKLLTEQAGGYYDVEKKQFFIASWLNPDEQKPVMIHELTHALQDQHFNLKKMLEDCRRQDNDDRMMAQQALLEGDATVVMLQYFLDPLERHFSELPDLAFFMRTQMSGMQSQYSVFKNAPSFLQEMLLFPYGYGASFLQYAWKQKPSWQFINKIYSDLPDSTEQIMHPEKYFSEIDKPKPVNAEAYADRLGKNWGIAYKNILGEFALGRLLSLHFTDERSAKSAAGWGGDQVLLLENKTGQDVVLVSTLWDDAEDSEKFYAAMDEWFRRHYPGVPRTEESPEGFSLIKDGEFHALRREGSAVRFIIGVPEADSSKLNGF